MKKINQNEKLRNISIGFVIIIVALIVILIYTISLQKDISLSPREQGITRNIEFTFNLETIFYDPCEPPCGEVEVIDSLTVVDSEESVLTKDNYFFPEQGARGHYFKLVGLNGEIARYPIQYPIPDHSEFIFPVVSQVLSFKSTGEERKIEVYFNDEKVGEHVLQQITCNRNSVCESQRGENNAFCPDCLENSLDRYCDPDGLGDEICDGDCAAIFGDYACTVEESCSNSLQDYNELGIDCGGECEPCKDETLSGY